jgi:beta-mannosidase
VWTARVAVEGHAVTELLAGWVVAGTEPDRFATPDEVAGIEWRPVFDESSGGAPRAPGATAGADLDDAHDWWFRTTFAMPAGGAGAEVVLAFEGLATLTEVFLSGERILESETMFAHRVIDVGALGAGEHELWICARALAPRLRERRRPRARWRTGLVSDGNLRFFRTMLMGRAPGFAPGPPLVGPWRPVRLETRRGVLVDALTLRTRVEPDGASGLLTVRARLRRADGETLSQVVVELEGPSCGSHRAELSLVPADGAYEVSGTLAVEPVARWWPHTHGDPALYEASLAVSSPSGLTRVRAGRVGFRELASGEHLEQEGLALRVNGVPVFARGALWTPLERAGDYAREAELRASLERLVDAGMNMVRIPGTATYETARFHDLCDELGILVWQDLMFANLDYPETDPAFMDTVADEVRQVMHDLGGHPSLAVVCGSSEVAQQIAMLGLDPALADGPLFGELLPGLVAAADVDAVYVPSAPWGGERPFRPDRGVANYFGVGGYRRPLDDARRARVRFAAECLAFANVPDDEALSEIAAASGGRVVVHHPLWKAGVPRDVGTGWDFDDVRDHYLATTYGVDGTAMRSVDPEGYLEISRAVSGEVMAAVFGEWRRSGSDCAGALVLWWRDLRPGAGWGLLDHRGEPKVAYHHLRRMLAPVAVWSTDEGMAGLAVHIANDRPSPLEGHLRVTLYRDRETKVDESATPVAVPAHGTFEADVESLIGRFVDASWAYRFGPPGHDLVVLSLERLGPAGPELLAQSFRLPAVSLPAREPPDALGLDARLERLDEDTLRLVVGTRRFVHGLRAALPGFAADDDCFSIEPGGTRRVLMRRRGRASEDGSATITALNLAGRVHAAVE